MREFLDRNGFDAVPTEDLNEITRLVQAGAVGMVISTSVISGSNKSRGAMRGALPDIPILAAALRDSRLGSNAAVLAVVHRDDISQPARGRVSSERVRRHFA